MENIDFRRITKKKKNKKEDKNDVYRIFDKKGSKLISFIIVK